MAHLQYKRFDPRNMAQLGHFETNMALQEIDTKTARKGPWPTTKAAY